MYSGHARLCVRPRPHAHTTARIRIQLGEYGTGCPLVVHYWADLQSVHGLRCYDNIARTRNVSECSVLPRAGSICCGFVVDFVVQLVV